MVQHLLNMIKIEKKNVAHSYFFINYASYFMVDRQFFEFTYRVKLLYLLLDYIRLNN